MLNEGPEQQSEVGVSKDSQLLHKIPHCTLCQWCEMVYTPRLLSGRSHVSHGDS